MDDWLGQAPSREVTPALRAFSLSAGGCCLVAPARHWAAKKGILRNEPIFPMPRKRAFCETKPFFRGCVVSFCYGICLKLLPFLEVKQGRAVREDRVVTGGGVDRMDAVVKPPGKDSRRPPPVATRSGRAKALEDLKNQKIPNSFTKSMTSGH